MAADPRGPKGVKKYLKHAREKFEALKPEEKKNFDKERLENPYADSRIHIGAKSEVKVARILAGIDADEGEVLLADRLADKGKKVDLLLGHHPIGPTLADLADVMDMLSEMFHDLGVPIHVAENLMGERIGQVARSIHPVNHNQPVDMAKILKINLMNIHTPCDNLVTAFLNKEIKKIKPVIVRDVLNLLKAIPEYQKAEKLGAGPKLIAGKPTNSAGKVLVDMTGGTSPNEKIYDELSKAGVSTIVGMHMKETAIENAKKAHMNIVIAGHISSDSLGMNLFLDELAKKGIEIIPCSGLIRVERFKRRAARKKTK